MLFDKTANLLKSTNYFSSQSAKLAADEV